MADERRCAMRRMVAIAALAAASVLSARCGGGSGGGSALVSSPPTISGAWEYGKVPATASGLDYFDVQRRPIRNAIVQLITIEDDKVVRTGVTDQAGRYGFDYPETGLVRVRVLAQSTTPSVIQVEDNTASDEVWAADSPPIQMDGAVLAHLNFVVPLGWDGAAYTEHRLSGPFNILDRCQLATEKVLAVRPDLKFPDLDVNWSPDNTRSRNYDVRTGDIGSSHFDGREIYLLGKADVDTDEFDDHVVVREWARFFEARLSRSDSLRGPHFGGPVLDPTVAFSEGLARGIAAIVLAPDTLHANTSGVAQASADAYDVEDNSAGDPNPGWFSERSIQFVVYDLFDANPEPWDLTNLGLAPIVDVLVGAQRTTCAMATIYSFITALKNENPRSAVDIDTLCADHRILVNDEWGTGETNGGPPSVQFPLRLLPIYRTVPIGSPALSVRLSVFSHASRTRYFRFEGNGAPVRIAVTTRVERDDVRIVLYEKGDVKGESDELRSPAIGDEVITFNSTMGTTYVLRIQYLGDLPWSHVDLNIQ